MTIEHIMQNLNGVTVLSTLVRLLLAAITGGMVGMDRERRKQAAGLRTFMLVCIGSALVMITNQYVASVFGMADYTRLGAQVISGIGFLGAGTILVDRHRQVRGLTTAAGLWACACMGLAIGIGFYAGAIIACLLILSTIAALNKIEHRIVSKSSTMDICAAFGNHAEVTCFTDWLINQGVSVIRMEVGPYDGHGDLLASHLSANFTLGLSRQHQHQEVLAHMNQIGSAVLQEELY